MIWLLSEGVALIRRSRSFLNSSSAERLVAVSDAVVDLAEDVDGFSGREPGRGAPGSAEDCVAELRCDHQYQPPIPSPRNSRKNKPRIAPCHQRNCDGVSDLRPYDSIIESVGADLASLACGTATVTCWAGAGGVWLSRRVTAESPALTA